MSNSSNNNFNVFKSVLAAIVVVAVVGFVVKKLVGWLKTLDDDSFKWDEEVGHDLKDLIEKYKRPVENVQRVAKQAVEKVSEAVHKAELDLNERQQKIYELVRSMGEVTMQHINSTISDVSDRTLRRDMNRLENKGLITRSGKTKDSVYSLK